MLTSNEKKGGRDFNLAQAEILRNAIDVCELEDIGYVGHDYTWTNNRDEEKNVQERLDRFLANNEWRNFFVGSFVSHLSKRNSDHLPLLLCISEGVGKPKKKKFRKRYKFEEMWLRDESCRDILRMRGIVVELKDCRARMEELMREEQSDEIIAQMRALDEFERREDLFWRQRSRQDWLRDGDKNTPFFHQKESQRKERNHIREIKDAAGNSFREEEQISEVLASHFEELFSSGGQGEAENVIDKVDLKISEEQFADLIAPFNG
uniref:Uncharacterized protein n=1 Tax=Chenopodium quinoa TaxID=63459 RepID=A0A803MWZ9_CHEQI